MTHARSTYRIAPWLGWLCCALLWLTPTQAEAAARFLQTDSTVRTMTPQAPARERTEEALDWVAFGVGGSSLLLLGIGLIAGLGILTLPGVILGVLSLGFSWWRRRWRKRKNWKTFVGQLAGSLALLTLLIGGGLIWFA
jgi:Flp pilus assembly protein TadB